MSAADNPTGTVRRVVTNWGFAHYIKLDQASRAPCWKLYDAYGSMDGISENALLTDAQIDERDNTKVVYVPEDDYAWMRRCGLRAPSCAKCGELRHDGPLGDCESYYPDKDQIV